MNFKIDIKNIKTTVFGLIAFAFTVPALVTALQAAANHEKVNWVAVLIAVAAAANAAGNVSAKDATNHSTINEVTAATEKAGEGATPLSPEVLERRLGPPDSQ